MALSYDDANTGLFTHLGRLVKYFNDYLNSAGALEGQLQDILDAFQLGDMDLADEGLADAYESFKAQYVTRRQVMVDYATRRLNDRDTVLEELVLSENSSVQDVLHRLIKQMVADSETIDASTVSISSVSMYSGNEGNGFVLTTKQLDGVASPGNGMGVNFPAHPNYAGRDTELCWPEDVRVECTRDSYQEGLETGSEEFRWSCGPSDVYLGVENNAGSGDSADITVLNAERVILNGDFEDFSSDVPVNWDLDAGTSGTNVGDDTTTVYRNLTSLKLTGDGSTASIQISQDPPVGTLVAQRRYLVAVLVKADASIGAGTLTIQFEGTGYTAASLTDEVQTFQISGTPTGGTFTLSWDCPYRGTQTTAAIAYNATAATIQAALRLLPGLESVVVANTAGSPPDQTVSITLYGCVGNVAQLTSTSSLTGGTPVLTHGTTTPGVEGEQIVLPPSALPTTWALRYFWVTMPRDVPVNVSDAGGMELVIKWTGTPTNAKNVYIDSLACGPVRYVAGHGVSIVAGSTPFAKNDRGTYTVSNDEAGVFQEFFKIAFGVQLPSNTAGAETIADSLAG